MFRIAFLLLACSTSMTIVTCQNIPIFNGIPSAVNRLDMQCWNAGHSGLCSNINFETGELDCAHVLCAAQGKLFGETKRAVDIGIAADGTHCRQDRVCLNGSCVPLPPNTLMPEEVGGSLRLNYECMRPSSRKSYRPS